ncbi:MAG: prepilin-type N-terminal cleavage/methylation domain-containing protein [Chthoniobacterales bacterium]|nr:prepilin-type N-terminal cleavage/methylation domain-containing protein [Chthoniobacterales bacterium]
MSDPAGSLGKTALRTRSDAFTVVELLVVMAIILVLAGLVLGTSGYVHSKAATSRAQAEIQAMSAGLENYKADNAIYPSNADTDALDARAMASSTYDPTTTSYTKTGQYLYVALTGDSSGNGSPATGKSYITFKTNQLSSTTPYTVIDPFGYSYGYSTAYPADLNKTPPVDPPTHGYNPTFDLWSTAGTLTSAASNIKVSWVKNW